uniref:BED-type domain-containing protein n=2 Tax=Meloidogyne TaxID=189290 RepID=A0A914MVT6_MELIC
MSLIWKYFSLSGRVAFCKSCKFSKNHPPRSPTTFLISHLRASHPKLYDDFSAKKKAKEPQQQTLKEHLWNRHQQHLRSLMIWMQQTDELIENEIENEQGQSTTQNTNEFFHFLSVVKKPF